MPVDKLLSRIRGHVSEMTPLLELFTDPAVQPGVSDCDRLLKSMGDLAEHLAVLKHLKQNYELSPSFTLHARISEAEEQQQITPQQEKLAAPETPKSSPEPEKTANAEKPSEQKNNRAPAKPLHIAVNDKFRFINELFAHNNSEYGIAIEQLSNLQTWNETEIYLTSLKNLYGWKENHEAVKHFYGLMRKRFQ